MQTPVNILDRFYVTLLRLFPKTLLSRITGLLAIIPLPYPLNILFIRIYASLFRVDLSEAEYTPSHYKTLNAFFTRKLKPDARTHDPDMRSILSPVDGTVMEAGRISEGRLLQAKKWHYTLHDLLQDREVSNTFREGSFCTLYLSPSDYHRIHSPLDAEVTSLQYISGHLFPVNRFSLNRIQNLFVLNERIVLQLNTGFGKMALVMVGATNVGKLRVFFEDYPMAFFRRGPFRETYDPGVELRRGNELGCFELGSTVILLFEKDRIKWSIRKDDLTRVGKSIGAGIMGAETMKYR
jgi:phosphatidylserine decarboxylase